MLVKKFRRVFAIIIGSVLCLTLNSCREIVEYKSVNSDSPYLVNSFLDEFTSYDGVLIYKVSIGLKSNSSNSNILSEYVRCDLKVILKTKNKTFTAFVAEGGCFSYYSATFDIRDSSIINSVNDDHTLELIFTDKDSVVSAYEYKNK